MIVALSDAVSASLITLGGATGLGALGGIIKTLVQLTRVETRLGHVEDQTEQIWRKLNGEVQIRKVGR